MDHIEQKIDKMDMKLDKVLEKLGEHDVVLVKHGLLHKQNAEQLVIHIRRTEQNEQAILLVEKETRSLIKWRNVLTGAGLVLLFLLEFFKSKLF